MRTWHALVLLLSCGCSLDTKPSKAGAAMATRDASDARGLAAVSFDVWRRVSRLGGPDAAVGDDHADASTGEPAHEGAAGSGKGPRGATTAPPEPAARGDATPGQPASRAREMGVAGQSGAGGQTGPAATRFDDLLDAGLTDSAGSGAAGGHMDAQVEAAAGQAADGGGLDAALPARDAAAPEEPDTPEQQQARTRVLDLVQKTLDNAFGPVWTSDALALAATVRALSGLPENQRTRPLVAEVLIELRATNACRFDNAYDCRELCSALDEECTVCRWDTSCQVSVTLMCAPQPSFSCDPWQ